MGRQQQQYDAVAGTNEEQLLHSTTLIDDPSFRGGDADGEDPQYSEYPIVKGVQQPTQCRDSWAAILFYAQLLCCVIVARLYGVPATTRSFYSSGENNHEGHSSSAADYKDYKGLLTGETISFFYALLLL